MENCNKWNPPVHGFSKLNFDGSAVKNRSASIDFVIRNEKGCPIFAGARKVTTNHVPITEALAFREGLQSMLRQNFLKIQVEGDSKLISTVFLTNAPSLGASR